MTKIYEALDNAGKERGQAGPSRRAGGTGLGITASKPLEDKLLSLCQRVESMLGKQGGIIIEVVSAQPGDDAARIARQFAKLAAARMAKRVLLAGAANQTLMTEASGDWTEMAESGQLQEDAFRQVSGSNLYVTQVAGSASELAAILGTSKLSSVLEQIRAQFDLTVVVAPALGASPEGYQLASVVDGVVVVVEAGKTRWQAVRRDIIRMQAQGATVLGTILNKRRYYIPNFIYRRI